MKFVGIWRVITFWWWLLVTLSLQQEDDHDDDDQKDYTSNATDCYHKNRETFWKGNYSC